MKHVPRSQQHHDFYAKYRHQDSKISALLGECGLAVVDRTVISEKAMHRWNRYNSLQNRVELRIEEYPW